MNHHNEGIMSHLQREQASGTACLGLLYPGPYSKRRGLCGTLRVGVATQGCEAEDRHCVSCAFSATPPHIKSASPSA